MSNVIVKINVGHKEKKHSNNEEQEQEEEKRSQILLKLVFLSEDFKS